MKNKNKVWGMIPARLESSRLPKKALKNLHGLPMVVHVAKRASMCSGLDEVLVCTDSVDIVTACVQFGVKVTLTPSKCRNGTERIAAAKRILGISDRDIVIDIQGDEPLVDPKSISQVIDYVKFNEAADIALPYIEMSIQGNENIVKIAESQGKVIYLSRCDIPYEFTQERMLKKHLSVIGFRGGSLVKFSELPRGQLENIENVELLRALEGGLSIDTFEIKADSFSVDTYDDFMRAERALRNCEYFLNNYEDTI